MKLATGRPRYSIIFLLLTLIISATVAAVQAQPAPDMTGRFAVRYGDKLENGKMVAVPPQAGIYDQKGVYHPIDLVAHPMSNEQIHNLFAVQRVKRFECEQFNQRFSGTARPALLINRNAVKFRPKSAKQ